MCLDYQADLPLLWSWVHCLGGFYKHVVPTALMLGWRDSEVFQRAIKRPA